MKSVFQSTWPYQDDDMSLPVEDVDQAIPFYENVMGFKVVSRGDLLIGAPSLPEPSRQCSSNASMTQ